LPAEGETEKQSKGGHPENGPEHSTARTDSHGRSRQIRYRPKCEAEDRRDHASRYAWTGRWFVRRGGLEAAVGHDESIGRGGARSNYRPPPCRIGG